MSNYYKWLDKNLVPFLKEIKVPLAEIYEGLIVAHGDKCRQYFTPLSNKGIENENHIACLFILSYIEPYSKEVRDTDKGWVRVDDWILENYNKFKDALVKVENY